ncbi:MAG: nuclear transport factor 2 family protein [Phycisphaerales bacterium]|nr:nuclear transport factor 2 family protein [Phycisphaerales bacterium]MCI0674513.1 nuclear transport factor 2 family protein [Phycisphaerales bacterium]
MMRLALIVSVLGGLSLVACSHHAPQGEASMDVAEHVIGLERSALDRWIRADPDGYLGLYAHQATYFDPFRDKRVDGLDELNAQVAGMKGITLPFTQPRYDMMNPRVDVEGDIAVLSFNLVNYGKPSGSAEETVLARWNATQVYRRLNGAWRIIHTHWSFTQPQLGSV